ncbi:MAG: hypothetical protein WC254_04025 [Candidatus Woesearchaeota archaeon]|jgi:hypothetical protein
MKKTFLFICICSFLLLTGCDNDSLGTIMPASQCQVTCVDDYTGETYGIAFRAISFVNNNELTDYIGDGLDDDEADGCYSYVYAYRGRIEEDGSFEPGSLIATTLKAHEQESFYDRLELSFTDSDIPEDLDTILLSNDVIYKLLYESTTNVIVDTSVSAYYNHHINPCVLEGSITLTHSCDNDDNNIDTTCEKNENNGEISSLIQLTADANTEGAFTCPDGDLEECVTDINMEDIDSGVLTLLDDIITYLNSD